MGAEDEVKSHRGRKTDSTEFSPTGISSAPFYFNSVQFSLNCQCIGLFEESVEPITRLVNSVISPSYLLSN